MLTDLAQVQDQIQKTWAPRFTKELRETFVLPSLVSREYEGEIKTGGDTVRVSQLVAPQGQLKTVGTDADTFAAEQLDANYIDIKADKRAVAAHKFSDLTMLQSQLESQDSEIKNGMIYAINRQINAHLYSLVAPSTSAPDHLIGSVTAMALANVKAARVLAAQAKWDRLKAWYALLDPVYYADVLTDTTLGSKDFGAEDAPIVGGQLALPRLGWNFLEDNSQAILNVDAGATEKVGLFFHPDFLHMVSQTQVQVKISDLHSQGQFGYLMSVDLIFGAKLGIDGASKHIVIQGS